MQSIDIGLIFNIAWLVVSVLLGGLVTRLVIRKLEIQEREREGDFLALIYLMAAENHIIICEQGNIGAMTGSHWRNRKNNVVNGLIQSAAKSQKKYREKLYVTAKAISKISFRDPSIRISSSEIHSMITEMESSYFKITSNNGEE